MTDCTATHCLPVHRASDRGRMSISCAFTPITHGTCAEKVAVGTVQEKVGVSETTAIGRIPSSQPRPSKISLRCLAQAPLSLHAACDPSHRDHRRKRHTWAMVLIRPVFDKVWAGVNTGDAVQRAVSVRYAECAKCKDTVHLSYWDGLIREYFTPKAVMRLTLWDSMNNEGKRFAWATIREVQAKDEERVALESDRKEKGRQATAISSLVAKSNYLPNMEILINPLLLHPDEWLFHAVLENDCLLIARYKVWFTRLGARLSRVNVQYGHFGIGHIVTLRGPLTAHLAICAAPPSQQPQGAPSGQACGGAENDSNPQPYAIAGTLRTKDGAPLGVEEKEWAEPSLMIESGSIPGELVNAFGIPRATMRCLELWDSMEQLADLISNEQGEGPLVALKLSANKIREEQAQLAMIASSSKTYKGA
ncbi:hypothetical protein R3P38DRAFT_3358056 [Favolaschia claudopus]|uniref:Uncharacterized protein n=1 Tax=Favolaschia claudopus TaxID=2862362 RepID=A0AAW0B4R0_9AGAR